MRSSGRGSGSGGRQNFRREQMTLVNLDNLGAPPSRDGTTSQRPVAMCWVVLATAYQWKDLRLSLT
jgi:hypothetical protein